jgi:hypothetical protein
MKEGEHRLFRGIDRLRHSPVVLVTVGALTLASCGGEPASTPTGTVASPNTAADVGASPDSSANPNCNIRLVGQNRWDPVGASIRQEPDILAPKIGSLAGNEVTKGSYWIDTHNPAYPTNPDPWKGNFWYSVHTGGAAGWVNSAAVRGESTFYDPTATSTDGGTPAPLPPECQRDN